MNTVRLPHQRHPFVTFRPLALALLAVAILEVVLLACCA